MVQDITVIFQTNVDEEKARRTLIGLSLNYGCICRGHVPNEDASKYACHIYSHGVEVTKLFT